MTAQWFIQQKQGHIFTGSLFAVHISIFFIVIMAKRNAETVPFFRFPVLIQNNLKELQLHTDEHLMSLHVHYLSQIYSVSRGCTLKASFSSMSSCCKNNSIRVRPGINTILLHVFAAALLLLDCGVLHVKKHHSRGRSEYLLVNRLVNLFIVLQRK